jgi:hypothetical protein
MSGMLNLVFWLAWLAVPAGLAYALPHRFVWIAAAGAVLAFVYWTLFWFGSTEGEDGTWSRAEVVAFGAIACGVAFVVWVVVAAAGWTARRLVTRRSARRSVRA